MTAERLGRYELLKKIARGGMAEIYLARSGSISGIEKAVVVKKMLPQFATEDEFIQMFLDEARVAAGLNHPNVVQMYDVGDDAGRYYIAMEYLHGEDVRGIVRTLRRANKRMPIEHAVHVGIGVTAGLHHAHEAVGNDGKPLQIVHRDISPHNVFITFDGAVKVVDFGIAKSRNRKSETRAGTMKGKVPYMSPEQLRGDNNVDRRTDVYAVGVMLYEITVGARPHAINGNGEFELMMAIARGDIRPPSAVHADYPKGLERIILKALARDPGQRYQTARDMQADLEKLARDLKLAVSPTNLVDFMLETFGARVDAWRTAQAEGRDLAEAAVQLEEQRQGSRDEHDSEVDVSVQEVEQTLNVVSVTTDFGVDVVRRELSGVEVVTIQGRLTEAFQGSALGRMLTRVTLMDLSLIERVTSFGVREWLAMVESAKPTVERMYLARCSDAFVNQLSMIRSLVGSAQLVSFFAPYVCEQCGTSFRHLIDVERDADALRAGKAPETECATCGGRAGLDDDPSYLAFAAPHLDKSVPADVRAALAALERETRASTEQVEKVVVGAVTKIHVRRTIDRAIRWKRVLDGIEGAAVIDLSDVGKVSEDGALNFVQALRGLDPEVKSLGLIAAPSSVLTTLGKVPLRVSVESVVFEGECPSCGPAARSAPVALATLEAANQKGEALAVTCRRCNAPLSVPSWPRVAETLFPGGAAREPVAAPKASTTAPTIKPPATTPAASSAPQRSPWLWPAVGFGAVVLIAGGVLASRSQPPDTSTVAVTSSTTVPSASPSASSEAPPGWLGRASEQVGDKTLLLGVGVAETEDQALATARAQAIRAFALTTLDAMPDGDAKRFVVERVGSEGARARVEDAPAVAQRWLRQVGTLATPARAESFVQHTPEGVRVSARYSLTKDELAQAAKFYAATTPLGDLALAPVFPLLESVVHSKGELIVVSAPQKRAAHHVEGVRVGDILLEVEGAPVPSPSALEAARTSAGNAPTHVVFESGGARARVTVSP